MNKKIFNFILITFISVLTLFLIELAIWNFENKNLKLDGVLAETADNISFHSGIKPFNVDFNYFPDAQNNWGMAPVGTKYKKKPIVVFGTLYEYENTLPIDKTFEYKLSEKAKTPVYNRSFLGWGIQHMLYQSKLDCLYEQIPEPSHVIYTFTYDNIRRLYLLTFSSWNILNEEFNLRYKEKNGELIEKRNTNKILNQIKRLYLTNKIQHHIVHKSVQDPNQIENHYDFAHKHFLAARQEMQKHWKNTKFVVLFLDNTEGNNYLKELLEDDNFIALDVKNLTKEPLKLNSYEQSKNEHLWELFIPALVKKLEL